MLGQSVLSGASVAGIVRPLFLPGRIAAPITAAVAAAPQLAGGVAIAPVIVGIVQQPSSILGAS